jgi:hypothetical protein
MNLMPAIFAVLPALIFLTLGTAKVAAVQPMRARAAEGRRGRGDPAPDAGVLTPPDDDDVSATGAGRGGLSAGRTARPAGARLMA